MYLNPDQLGAMIQEATAKTAHDVAEATATAMNRQARKQVDVAIKLAIEKCDEIAGQLLKAADTTIAKMIDASDRAERVRLGKEYLARLKEIGNAQ